MADAAKKVMEPAIDYSDAMIVQSDNAKQVALAQIMTQQFALQQMSLDRELAMAAKLEYNLEKLDVGLQEAKLGFIQAMTAEEHNHTEKLAEMALKQTRLENGGHSETFSFDIPAPDEF